MFSEFFVVFSLCAENLLKHNDTDLALVEKVVQGCRQDSQPLLQTTTRTHQRRQRATVETS